MNKTQYSLDLAEETWGSTPITRSELYLRTIALQNERIIELLEKINHETGRINDGIDIIDATLEGRS